MGWDFCPLNLITLGGNSTQQVDALNLLSKDQNFVSKGRFGGLGNGNVSETFRKHDGNREKMESIKKHLKT